MAIIKAIDREAIRILFVSVDITGDGTTPCQHYLLFARLRSYLSYRASTSPRWHYQLSDAPKRASRCVVRFTSRKMKASDGRGYPELCVFERALRDLGNVCNALDRHA